jgi:Xaa-Pro aminopeptidase
MSWPSTRSSGTCAPVADRREARQARLRERLRAEGLAGLVVTHLPNIRYLTGFSGSSGAMLVLPGETVLVTDFRYETQAPEEVADHARVEVVQADLWERVAKLARDGTAARAGRSERDHLVDCTEARRQGPGGDPSAGGPRGGSPRSEEGEDEVEAIRAAAQLAEEAFAAAVPRSAGIPESRSPPFCEAKLRRRGAVAPLSTIVASGPRACRTRGRPSGRSGPTRSS